MSTVSVNEQRERRAGELRDRAEAALDRSKAMAGLAEMVRNTPAPVQRWQPVWDNVAAQLDRDAAKFQGVSQSCAEHIETLECSVEAHNKWIPKRPTDVSE